MQTFVFNKILSFEKNACYFIVAPLYSLQWKLFILSSLVFVQCGCGKPTDNTAKQERKLTGRVLNSRAEGIGGAEISLNGKSWTKSDSDGNCGIDKLSKGAYEIRVVEAVYGELKETITIEEADVSKEFKYDWTIIFSNHFNDGAGSLSGWSTSGDVTIAGGNVKFSNQHSGIMYNSVLGANKDCVVEICMNNPQGADGNVFYCPDISIKEPSSLNMGWFTGSDEIWARFEYRGHAYRYFMGTGGTAAALRNGKTVYSYEWHSGGVKMYINGNFHVENTHADLYGSYNDGATHYGGTQPSYALGFKFEAYLHENGAAHEGEIDYIIIKER